MPKLELHYSLEIPFPELTMLALHHSPIYPDHLFNNQLSFDQCDSVAGGFFVRQPARLPAAGPYMSSFVLGDAKVK
jgi:hypothetical protein